MIVGVTLPLFLERHLPHGVPVAAAFYGWKFIGPWGGDRLWLSSGVSPGSLAQGRSLKEPLDFLIEILDQNGFKEHRTGLAAMRDELAAAVVAK